VSSPHYREEYLEAAILDLIEIQAHYDAAELSLGIDFSNAVTNRLEMILAFPESAAVFSAGGARKIAVGRFPYNIIYVIRGDIVFIVTVVHQKRHPNHWISRLRLLD
jgi:plasmid stabilization system protein ParE